MRIISALLGGATRLDAYLYRTLGAPYGVLLSAGLVIEIGRHARELVEHAGHGAASQVLPLALDAALLLHTAGALHERWERRLERRRRRG